MGGATLTSKKSNQTRNEEIQNHIFSQRQSSKSTGENSLRPQRPAAAFSTSPRHKPAGPCCGGVCACSTSTSSSAGPGVLQRATGRRTRRTRRSPGITPKSPSAANRSRRHHGHCRLKSEWEKKLRKDSIINSVAAFIRHVLGISVPSG